MFLQVETGISENFLSYIKGVKNPFDVQGGWWDFSRVATLKFVFLLSYNGNLRDLRDLHGLPQESSVSM